LVVFGLMVGCVLLLVVVGFLFLRWFCVVGLLGFLDVVDGYAYD
jgi:hypothetical protein